MKKIKECQLFSIIPIIFLIYYKNKNNKTKVPLLAKIKIHTIKFKIKKIQ